MLYSSVLIARRNEIIRIKNEVIKASGLVTNAKNEVETANSNIEKEFLINYSKADNHKIDDCHEKIMNISTKISQIIAELDAEISRLNVAIEAALRAEEEERRRASETLNNKQRGKNE